MFTRFRRPAFFVCLCVAILVAGMTAGAIRESPNRQSMVDQVTSSNPALSKTDANGRSLYTFQTVNVEPGLDGLFVRQGEKVISRHGFKDGKLSDSSRADWRAGSRWLLNWWALALFCLVQVTIWWRVKYGALAVFASVWSSGAFFLYATAYLRLAQLWTDGLLLLVIGYALWKIWTQRKTASEEKSSVTGEIQTTELQATKTQTAAVDSPQQPVVTVDGGRDIPIDNHLSAVSDAVGVGTKEVGRSRLWQTFAPYRWHFAALTGVLVSCWLTLSNVQTVDVAWSNLEGAGDFLHGQSIYGSETIVFHGDTYPPFVYLSYVFGALLSPVDTFFSDVIGAQLTNLFVVIGVGALAWRRDPRIATAWLWSIPGIMSAGSGGNDGLVAAGIFLALLGYIWAYPFAVAVKVIPIVWIGSWLREHPVRQWWWLVGFGIASVLLIVVFGGTAAVSDFIHGLSFQSSRQSVNDLAVLYEWNWWHPVTRAALVALAIGAFTARGGEFGWWAMACGSMAFVSAQYVNSLYTVWVWALIVGVAWLQSRYDAKPSHD